jgi:hypothetical protein
MAILCHRWWPLQESVFFALEGEPVLDAGHALYCSTYYSRAVSVARSHKVPTEHNSLFKIKRFTALEVFKEILNFEKRFSTIFNYKMFV